MNHLGNGTPLALLTALGLDSGPLFFPAAALACFQLQADLILSHFTDITLFARGNRVASWWSTSVRLFIPRAFAHFLMMVCTPFFSI